MVVGNLETDIECVIADDAATQCRENNSTGAKKGSKLQKGRRELRTKSQEPWGQPSWGKEGGTPLRESTQQSSVTWPYTPAGQEGGQSGQLQGPPGERGSQLQSSRVWRGPTRRERDSQEKRGTDLNNQLHKKVLVRGALGNLIKTLLGGLNNLLHSNLTSLQDLETRSGKVVGISTRKK